MTLISALGGGLFIIPLGLFLASVWSFYRGYKASKSGSWYWGKNEHGVDTKFESDENVPIYKTAGGVYGAILLVASIGSLVWMISEK